jgi:hypothetical protein
MVETGTNVRVMDPMNKALKEKAFLNSYVSVTQEIPAKCFEDEAICPAMLLAYKGARKKWETAILFCWFFVLLFVLPALADFCHFVWGKKFWQMNGFFMPFICK